MLNDLTKIVSSLFLSAAVGCAPAIQYHTLASEDFKPVTEGQESVGHNGRNFIVSVGYDPQEGCRMLYVSVEGEDGQYRSLREGDFASFQDKQLFFRPEAPAFQVACEQAKRKFEREEQERNTRFIPYGQSLL